MNEIIRSIESAQLRTDIPEFRVGDTVRVFVKVVEGSRERLQAFEGVVIARRNGSARETFTVRRTSYGVGVERTFPLHSPRLDHIEVIRRGKVRRAKLCNGGEEGDRREMKHGDEPGGLGNGLAGMAEHVQKAEKEFRVWGKIGIEPHLALACMGALDLSDLLGSPVDDELHGSVFRLVKEKGEGVA